MNGSYITIPITFSGKRIKVDWGDHTKAQYYSSTTSKPIRYNYGSSGSKKITIDMTEADDKSVSINYNTNASIAGQIQTIQVNSPKFILTSGNFSGCSNLTTADFGRTPNLASDISELFKNISNSQFEIKHIEYWDTSNVTNMSSMFINNSSSQKLKIGNWDTSKVTDMSYMFSYYLGSFEDISTKQVTVNGNTYTAWDTGNVEHMNVMFSNTPNFNQNIGNWNTENVEYMTYMFTGATKFNQDISRWDVNNVTSALSFSLGSALSPAHIPNFKPGVPT
jgi:surface protein